MTISEDQAKQQYKILNFDNLWYMDGLCIWSHALNKIATCSCILLLSVSFLDVTQVLNCTITRSASVLMETSFFNQTTDPNSVDLINLCTEQDQ